MSGNLKCSWWFDQKIKKSDIYGGYLEWGVIIARFGASGDPIEYSDWIAKDVQCFFGTILKQRFRYLKNPITLHDKEDIDYAFITCVIIHNMILKFYGTEYEIHRDKLNPKGGEDHDNIQVEEENDGHRKCIDQFIPTKKEIEAMYNALPREHFQSICDFD